ncbi:hypothetical protein [Gemmatimonas sp.]
MTAPVSLVPEDQPLDASVPPVPALPDRADAPVSETAERFLRTVIAEVPLELIEELHMFSPLRQGTVETGIAVIAVKVPVAVVEAKAEAGEPELFGEGGETVGGGDVMGGVGETGVATTGVATTGVATTGVATTGVATTGAATTGTATTEALTAEAQVAEAQEAEALTAESGAEVVIAQEGDDDEDVSVAEDDDLAIAADEADEALAMAIVAAPAKPVRHTVYTARYRYIIKGPERGKWESSIKAEADAPLITVEMVVRGVQRRAGEESEIVRYSAAQIARALRVPLTV